MLTISWAVSDKIVHKGRKTALPESHPWLSDMPRPQPDAERSRILLCAESDRQ
ncbi:MAG: hypothetical protein K2L86_08870 [Lachnospiraceae bacterium]|nr:hypothetical protein [Lachnospiraceae bacterium]